MLVRPAALSILVAVSLLPAAALAQDRSASAVVFGGASLNTFSASASKIDFGVNVAAELTPNTRYDQVVEALGGHGELVERPEQLRPALERAFASGKPACVNVMTDPTVVYPRSANLA